MYINIPNNNTLNNDISFLIYFLNLFLLLYELYFPFNIIYKKIELFL